MTRLHSSDANHPAWRVEILDTCYRPMFALDRGRFGMSRDCWDGRRNRTLDHSGPLLACVGASRKGENHRDGAGASGIP